jgi:hypothetical protein
MRAPTLVSMMVHIDEARTDVPPHEQWLAAGGALSNFVTALHFMGYGAKVLSGHSCPALAANGIRSATLTARARLAPFASSRAMPRGSPAS